MIALRIVLALVLRSANGEADVAADTVLVS
jgi:hypothetical protein